MSGESVYNNEMQRVCNVPYVDTTASGARKTADEGKHVHTS